MTFGTLGFRRVKGNVAWTAAGLLLLVGVFEVLYAYVLALCGWEMQSDLAPAFRELSSPWPLLIGIVIVGPAVEEVFFRGFLFGGLRSRYGWRVAAVISSALFAALHLQLAAFVPLFIFGFFAAYLYQRSNSIWPGMIVHMVNNGLVTWAIFGAIGAG